MLWKTKSNPEQLQGLWPEHWKDEIATKWDGKAGKEAGLGKIQSLYFAHVEFEVSISHLNRDVMLAVRYTNLETTLACRQKTKKLEWSHQEVNTNRQEKWSKPKPWCTQQ